MSFEEFTKTLSSDSPPAELNLLIVALWYDAKGNWEKAHTIAQDVEDKNGAWVHAYLHRKEGDEGNARFWYDRARRTAPSVTLQQEWSDIVKELLG